MKIYSMTATFGKLEHETLRLEPGLNIIEAPNEWGKSTWCAFLVSMLYGIDTRERSTKDNLADKDRYAPWSGTPMSGRIDLCWNGRDITIQRSSKNRPFSEFRAYETESGIEIPELNATNCGQQLLGVERSVFTRAGFVKLTDMPVTQDDSLRRRLNDLVTTGDDTGNADKLAETLKNLKNKCRHNRTGELPKAEAMRDELLGQLHTLQELQNSCTQLCTRQEDLAHHLKALDNHRTALKYALYLENAEKISICDDNEHVAYAQLQEFEALCAAHPDAAQLEWLLRKSDALQQQLMALELQPQPPKPEMPVQLERYADIEPQQAPSRAAQDAARVALLTKKAKGRNLWFVLLLMAAIGLAAAAFIIGGGALVAFGAAAGSLALAAVLTALIGRKKDHRELDAIRQRYAGVEAGKWSEDAQDYAAQHAQYAAAMEHLERQNTHLSAQRKELQAQSDALTGGTSLTDARVQWTQALHARQRLADAQKNYETARQHAQDVRSLAQPAPAPTAPDELTISLEDTERLLIQGRMEQQRLHQELGRAQGQMDTLGQEGLLKARLDTLNRRIARLEDTYYALEMAQDALHSATTALQRRFAPRISKRAQTLFSTLTDGRYQELSLSSDLSVNTSAACEDIQRPSQWRSDGTTDQLYLALRLAVAEELTPNAPLVLDDALVRFDDKRLKEALTLLKNAAVDKQVILFTCQSRENDLV